MTYKDSCPICHSMRLLEEFSYDSPPVGEIRFDFIKDRPYHRKILRCKVCNHYISTYKINAAVLYSGEYVHSNYQDEDGIHHIFKRIVSLDPSQSDNKGRVKRIVEFGEKYFLKQGQEKFIPTVLDVGSGLGVFPYEIIKAGWKCIALDPDALSIAHIKAHIDAETIHGDFMAVRLNRNYDLISFNRVLEHVEHPLEMLKKAKDTLGKGGLVYIEVPDGEMAAPEGKGREEFTIDHIHIFSFTSLSLLVRESGFVPLLIERLQEPSSKYTLRAFCRAYL